MKNYNKIFKIKLKIKIIILIILITIMSILWFNLANVRAMNIQNQNNIQPINISINPNKKYTATKPYARPLYVNEKEEKYEAKTKTGLTPQQGVVETPMSTEDLIITKCNELGIDSSIPVAISKLETGYFTSNAHNNYNNPGGIMTKVNGSYELKYFNTIEEGVDYFVSNLVNNYFNVGLYTAEEIGPKYCPGDPGWIYQINILKNR